MKKILFIFTLIFILIFMVACSNTESIEIKNPQTETITETAITPEEIIIEETTTTIIDDEIIIIDNDLLTFTIKSIEVDTLFETYNLNIFIENKTSTTNMISWDNVSINDYMIDPFWATEITAGKKENTSISFYLNDFEKNNFNYTDIKTIEFDLSVCNSENWDNYMEGTYIFSLDQEVE